MKSIRLGSSAFCPMLVLLIATVTISAPDSVIASFVSLKSLYFQVPTNNLELNSLEPTINLSEVLSTTNCSDNFKLISFFD